VEISKELTHEIFEEFPVVQDAYARYVPGVSFMSMGGGYWGICADWLILDQRGAVLVKVLFQSTLGKASSLGATVDK
jgi:hypothetical protein